MSNVIPIDDVRNHEIYFNTQLFEAIGLSDNRLFTPKSENSIKEHITPIHKYSFKFHDEFTSSWIYFNP